MNCWYSSPGPHSCTYGLFSICINVVYHLLSPPDPVCALLPKIASWNNTWITFPIQKFQWFLHPSRKKTKLLAHKAFQSQNSNGFGCSHLSLHQPTCHPFLHLNSSVCLCRECFNLPLPPKPYFLHSNIKSSNFCNSLLSTLCNLIFPPLTLFKCLVFTSQMALNSHCLVLKLFVCIISKNGSLTWTA